MVRFQTRALASRDPRVGRSSPIVVRDSVFVTTIDPSSGSRSVVRVDRNTGAVVWNKAVLTAPIENQHKFNTSASATPASDGKLIFSVFVDDQKLTVVAQDWNGNVVWQTSPGTFFSKHGFAASPYGVPEGLIINGIKMAMHSLFS